MSFNIRTWYSLGYHFEMHYEQGWYCIEERKCCCLRDETTETLQLANFLSRKHNEELWVKKVLDTYQTTQSRQSRWYWFQMTMFHTDFLLCQSRLLLPQKWIALLTRSASLKTLVWKLFASLFQKRIGKPEPVASKPFGCMVITLVLQIRSGVLFLHVL